MSPVLQRKSLRQNLGRDYIRDTIVGNTALQVGIDGTVEVIDRQQANPAFSGRLLDENVWLRVASHDYRVASFNAPSGAFVTQQLNIITVASGADYEVHKEMSASEKDRMLDLAIKRLTIREELGINTVDGLTHYSIGHEVRDVLGVWYYANPDGTLDRDKRNIVNSSWGFARTPTGNEIRLGGALAASQQLVLDAVRTATLGAADDATVNLPNEDWVLWGAAVQVYNTLSRPSAGRETGQYQKLRREAAREFTRLSSRFAPQLSRNPKLDNPF